MQLSMNLDKVSTTRGFDPSASSGQAKLSLTVGTENPALPTHYSELGTKHSALLKTN